MKKAAEYRQHAEACVRLAQEVPDRLRARLMDMARRWHALAEHSEQSERNQSAETVYEPPTQASTGATQQQQQIQPRK